MKLLYIITLSELGGAQKNVADLIEHFSKLHEVTLVTSSDGPLTEHARRCGASVLLIESMGRNISPFDDLRSLQKLLMLLRQVRPHLVHAHSSKAGLIARIAGRLVGIPVIFTAHGWGFKRGVPLVRRVTVWLTEFATARLNTLIVCPSQYDHDLAIQAGVAPKSKLVTIHNGVDPDAPWAAPERMPPEVVMVARFKEPKDQYLLIRAFHQADVTNATLTLVGDGPEIDMSKRLAIELGLNSRVRFLGDRRDVSELLADAQVFVLLSRYECLPISILEAMRAGLPVLASRVGGVPEQIEHAVSGFAVEHTDFAGIVDALKRLLEDSRLRKSMGDRGREIFLRRFVLSQMLEAMRVAYERVVVDRVRP
jgi:glycosyltransferase involved in cell wall biosynthesis